MGAPRATATDHLVTKRWREDPEYMRGLSRTRSSIRYEIRSAWYKAAAYSQTCAVCGDHADTFVRVVDLEDGEEFFRPKSSLTLRRDRLLAIISRCTPLCYRCQIQTRAKRERVPPVTTDMSKIPPTPW